MRLHPLPLAAAVLLAACSNSPPPATAPAPRPAAAATRIATPFDPLLRDEQRARDVQQIVNRQAARQKQAIEQQSH